MANESVESSAANDLVEVASCWDVPRADVVKVALAQAGIPASLGDTALLSWCWQFGNAMRGVKVYVRRCDLQRAREVLDAAGADRVDAPSWTCPGCGQRITGQWDACWRCGHRIDGEASEPPTDDAASVVDDGEEVLPDRAPDAVVLIGTIVLVALVLSGNLTWLVIAAVLFFSSLVVMQQLNSRPEEPIAARPETAAIAPPSRPRAAHGQRSNAMVTRAWQAAVLGVLVFPPLGFYSMWLLNQIGRRDRPLGRADTWRTWTAFFLNCVAILFCLAFVFLLARALPEHWFLEVSHAFFTGYE